MNKPIQWLLEDNNPSVRYFTMRDLEDRPADDLEMRKTRTAIMASPPVTKALAKQNPEGHWFAPEEFYQRTKYKGTVWTMLLLTQIGADPNDPRIRKGCESLIQNSFIRNGDNEFLSGGFAYSGNAEKGGKPRNALPCLTGNMLYILLSNGYDASDLRLTQTVDWFNRYQRYDINTVHSPQGWLYGRYTQCWGKHTCMMNIVKMLKGFTLIPPTQRSEATQRTINQAVEFVLRHRIFKRTTRPDEIANPDWVRFDYPLMWNTHALEMFLILTELGVRDDRMNDAYELILSLRDEDGTWKQHQKFKNRFIATVEKDGVPSKWITYLGLKAIKNYAN